MDRDMFDTASGPELSAVDVSTITRPARLRQMTTGAYPVRRGGSHSTARAVGKPRHNRLGLYSSDAHTCTHQPLQEPPLLGRNHQPRGLAVRSLQPELPRR